MTGPSEAVEVSDAVLSLASGTDVGRAYAATPLGGTDAGPADAATVVWHGSAEGTAEWRWFVAQIWVDK